MYSVDALRKLLSAVFLDATMINLEAVALS